MRRTLIALALAIPALAWSIAAQTTTVPQQDPRPIFKARTDIVRIDVTVLGPDGKPVHGLTREEFTILEDGKPREILGFGEVNIPDASVMPAWYREVKPDVRSALNGRVLVFVLDDAQTQYCLEIESWVNTVKRITGEIIDRMGPQDVAAVICTYDNRCDQDFTTDHDRLKAAIAQFKPKEAFIGLRVSAGITQSIARYLKTEPGQRRSLIYVTPTMPIRPRCWAPSSPNPAACSDTSFIPPSRSVESPAVRAAVQQAAAVPPPPSVGAAAKRRSSAACFPPTIPGLSWSGSAPLTAQQIIHTFEEAMRSGITVYGLSLWGLLPLGTEDPEDDLNGGQPPPGANGLRFTAPERSLPAETGGFMITRPADLEDGVEQIIAETGSYYLLGFEPPAKVDTGYNMLDGFREIEVIVNRPGLTIKTKRGHIVPKPVKPDPKPPPPASAALMGILPKTDLPLSVTAAPFAIPGSSDALVAIGIGINAPAPERSRLEKLEVQARAFTQGGDQRAGVVHKIENLVTASGGPDSPYDVVVQLKLKPGVYALRCSADNTTLGLAGSVYADIEIPDFAKAPLSMSGVLLHAAPATPTVFGASDILAGLPMAPTTTRAFTTRHRVKAFLRVYQGSAVKVSPVEFTMHVLDEKGAKVYEQASTLASSLFATNRSADVTVEVPVRDFSPGLHLLRIETTANGVTARRDVTFRVNSERAIASSPRERSGEKGAPRVSESGSLRGKAPQK